MATRHDMRSLKSRLDSAGAWCRVTGVVFIPAITAVIWVTVALLDVEDWRANKLCEAEDVCASPSSECDSVTRDVDILFGMYTAAIPCAGCKLCLMAVFWVAHVPRASPWGSALKTTARARVVSGLAFWGTMLALGAPAVVSTVYRYGILSPLSASYAEIVYPNANTSDVPSTIVSAVALAMGLAIEIYMLVRRARELRRAEGSHQL